MTIADREVDLTPEVSGICTMAHRFAEEMLRPIGRRLDALHDPAQVIAADSELWRVFARYRELGLDALDVAGTDLPPHEQARLRCIIGEELGWGDAGLAISLEVSSLPRMLALLSGRPELVERFGGKEAIGCLALTEPDHGSDFITHGFRVERMSGQPNCLARRDGDAFVITGQKAAWVSNGTVATAAALFCATDLGDGTLGSAEFLVSLDEPGVVRGKPLDKLGQRALNQGEIFFDGVRVPASHMIAGPEIGAASAEVGLALANTGMGSTFVGVAQAAFDLALAYAKERVQGGMPIFRHQSVRGRLFSMYRRIEAARALSRHAALHGAVGVPDLRLAIASKVTATQTAFEVASDALQIFGANGLCREYPVEKLLRDARASMIEDGCNEVLGLVASERL
jgi:acyl-CoA dehydrogenase